MAALLNSPIAEAFTYSHSFQRDIPARAYKSIPIPDNITRRGFAIDSLVKQYLQTLETDYRRAKDILLQIDVEILMLYNLPPRIERQLLDIFWGTRRRVPFEFDGYIHPEKSSSIPLHIYLSQQYKDATPKKILNRIPEKPKKEMAEYIKEVWERTP